MKPAAAIRSVAGLWLVQIVKMVASVAVSVLTIRHLGPQQYGILGVAAACVTPFTAFCGLPQGPLVVREFAAVGESGAQAVQSTAFGMRLAGGMVQLVLAAAAVALMGYGRDIQLVALFTSLAYLTGPFTVIGSVLEMDGRFDRVATIDLVASLSSIAVRAMLIVLDATLLWFAAAALVDACVQIGLYVLFNPRPGPIASRSSFSPQMAVMFLKDGWPLVLTGLAMSVTSRSDVIFISKFLGEQQVGWYLAAIRMTEVMYYFAGVISSVYFPTLAVRHGNDSAGYYRLITNSCGSAFWLGALLAHGLTIAAPLVLPVLLGPKFAPTIMVLQILAWTIPVAALGQAFSPSILIERATRVPLYCAIFAAFVSVALNVLLIPWLGLVGAAITSIVAPASGLGFLHVIYRDPKLLAAMMRAFSPALLVALVKMGWRHRGLR